MYSQGKPDSLKTLTTGRTLLEILRYLKAKQNKTNVRYHLTIHAIRMLTLLL